MDPLSSRKAQLEFQRNRDLGEIERRYEREIEETAEIRAAQAERYRGQSTDEVRRIQEDAKSRVDQAARIAEDQLRDYQRSTASVTEEAGRTLRSKASQLNQLQKEMESQQKKLSMAHSAAMESIRTNQETQQNETKDKFKTESLQAEKAYQQNLQDLKQRQQASLTQAQVSGMQAKQDALAQSAAEMESLKQNNLRQRHVLEEEARQFQGKQKDQLARERTQFEMQYADQSAKHTDTLLQNNEKHNKAVTQQREMQNRQISDLNQFYLDKKSQAEKQSKERIDQLTNQELLTLSKKESEYSLQKTRMDQEHRKKLEDLALRQSQTQLERQKALEAEVEQNLRDHQMQSADLKKKRETIAKHNEKLIQEQVGNIEALGQKEIERTKQDTMTQVGSYISKASDPFYSLKKLGAQLQELEDRYLVRMALPEHEQDSIRIVRTSKGLVLSGSRRFEARTQTAPGQWVATNSYQTFSETLPLSTPVDFSRMAREYKDGTLTISLPKARMASTSPTPVES